MKPINGPKRSFAYIRQQSQVARGVGQPKKEGWDSVPKLSDLFDGSTPKFSEDYSRFIAANQIPDEDIRASYYDAHSDNSRRDEYYSGMTDLKPAERMKSLKKKLASSHKPVDEGYHYVVAKHLYSQVDRHEDGTVKDIYSKREVRTLHYLSLDPDQINEALLKSAGSLPVAPELLGSYLGLMQNKPKLNCEHVVPQSWFGKKEPMRSDLHHLFACDIRENSHRGSKPYGAYKPAHAKGEVARATLYFMLRYPDQKLPYNSKDIAMLKEWSKEDPPTLYEKRRNAEIEKIQGTRNPFIDYPEWVDDFRA